jgi:hypothetical protein
MATSASIQFNGNTGEYEGLVSGVVCNLTNVDNTDATTWLWTIVSKPEGSASALTGASTATPSFTPDIVGSYNIELIVNPGLLDEISDTAIGSIISGFLENRYVAPHEITEYGVNGWATAQNKNIKNNEDALEIHAIRGFNDSGGDYSKGDILFSSSYNSIKSPYPLLLVPSATGKPTGIATGTILDGESGLIQTYNEYICTAFDTSGAQIGDPVYANFAGGLTLSRTPWVIGMVLSLHASTPTIFLDFQNGCGFFVDFDYIAIEWAEDGAVAPAVPEAIIDVNGKIRVRKFDDAASEDVVFPWETPSDIWTRGGVTFYAQLLVTESTAPSSEGVACVLSGYCSGDGDSLNGTFGAEVESRTGDFSDLQYDFRKTEESGKVTITGLAGGEIAMLKFYRDHDSVNDTYGQDIGVTGIKLFFTRKR